MQYVPGNKALHMDTVNVCPAAALTPHTGVPATSVLVFCVLYSWQKALPVGCSVGMAVGDGDG